ncbi:MAG: ring-cleaving dioxygenase [Gemmatimonadales bacterium]|nr:ring-cleaving dioxygenase [Gemmatimonadales bacterium]
MSLITGLHHVTAIAADPQANLDFYSGVLGMRLVKRTVNQDVPDTYHLFYADGEGHPGTDLTFFPWRDMSPGRNGTGLATEVGVAVPLESLDYWSERLSRSGVAGVREEARFGERALLLADVHGLQLSLVETGDEREFTPWTGGPVPARHQVRGLHSVRLWQRQLAPTENFLRAIGFAPVAEEAGWHRFSPGAGGSGALVDLREMPSEPRGKWGPGVVHHVAWRVPDDRAELAARAQVASAGAQPTEVIDRFWFRSVYFREPGGVLFEIATDGPGFAVDEPAESLGERLVLPPWFEESREQIERGLPPLNLTRK